MSRVTNLFATRDMIFLIIWIPAGVLTGMCRQAYEVF